MHEMSEGSGKHLVKVQQEVFSEVSVRAQEAVSEVSVRSMHCWESEMFRRGQIPCFLGKINQNLITAPFQGNHQPILNDCRNVSVLLSRNVSCY